MPKKKEIITAEPAKPVTARDVKSLMVVIREKKVLIDADVAKLYGVETKEVNQAVKNNPLKFPDGYIIETTKSEKDELVKNFDRFELMKHSSITPKAFTNRGAYMLATILKGDRAVSTTIAIVDAYAELEELKATMRELATVPEKDKQKKLMQQAGENISDLFGDDLDTTETEIEIELNFAVLKLRHKITRKKKDNGK